MRYLSLLILLAIVGYGQELVANGDFEDSLRHWSVEYDTTAGFWEVTVCAEFDPDPDLEAMVYKGLQYHCRIFQTIPVPTADLRFAGRTRFWTFAGTNVGYYAYAALILQYEDADGTLLGRTMVIRKTGYCPLRNTTTQHLIEVADEDWHDFDLNIQDELGNLSGVNPADVRCITLALESYGNGTPG